MLLIGLLTMSQGVFAQNASTPSFKDIPASHPVFAAVEYLKARGIISGYADGTFKPTNKVNRAEAIKIIVSPVVTADALQGYTTSSYADVSPSDWFFTYVEHGFKKMKIIKGPPETNLFHGNRTVTKAEFIKMFLPSFGVDVNAYSEIKLPVSTDVTDPSAWYYPSLRYAISSSMTMATKERLFMPEKELTRQDVAFLLHRFFLYKEGQRTQALLDEVGLQVDQTRSALEKQDVTVAAYASARALISARGALAAAPNENIVKAVVKLCEGYRSIVRAYQAGINGDFDGLIKLAGEAWAQADQGKKFQALPAIIQLQNDAKSLADSARALKQNAASSAQPK
ncbi:MAG: hypothetical protein RIQ56_733 [Candidatus Parcubacteria bacterium]